MRDTMTEPHLHEMLDDPIVRLVMARDRITPDDVRAEMMAARVRLARRAAAQRQDADRRVAAA